MLQFISCRFVDLNTTPPAIVKPASRINLSKLCVCVCVCSSLAFEAWPATPVGSGPRGSSKRLPQEPSQKASKPSEFRDSICVWAISVDKMNPGCVGIQNEASGLFGRPSTSGASGDMAGSIGNVKWNEPRLWSPKTTSWMVYNGHSISHSLLAFLDFDLSFPSHNCPMTIGTPQSHPKPVPTPKPTPNPPTSNPPKPTLS